MGSYLNPGSKGFQESLNSEIYVDKSGLIEKTNAVINTRSAAPDASASRWLRICLQLTTTVVKIPHPCLTL